jgi:hypothetical protein
MIMRVLTQSKVTDIDLDDHYKQIWLEIELSWPERFGVRETAFSLAKKIGI